MPTVETAPGQMEHGSMDKRNSFILLAIIRVTAPPKNESWKLEVGTLGEDLRREENYFTAGSLCHCVFHALPWARLPRFRTSNF